MAITLTLVGTGIKAQSATGSVEITLAQAVPAGKVLVLGAFATSVVTLTGVTDDKSNSYTRLTGVNPTLGNGYWVHSTLTTGLAIGDKIYGAFSGTSSRRFLIAAVVDGAAVSYIDAQGSSAQAGTSASPSVTTGPQAEAGEMVLTWLYVTSPLAVITEDANWDFVGETSPADNRLFHMAAKQMATTSSDTYAPTLDSSRDWAANWLALKQATASGYTLTAAAGAFSLSGQAAATRATRQLPAAARSFALAGINNALRRGYRLGADTRGYAVTGQAAGLARGLRLAAAATSYALTGIAATLTRTVSGRTLTAATGTFALTGQAAVTRAGRRLAAVSEGYTWARLAAVLRWTRQMLASAGSFALTGQSIGWGWTHILTPATADFAMTGQAATLRYSGGQGWQPVPSTPETWNPKPGKSETWTPASDTPEIWS